ncbi:hypothetical protein OG895_13160 [Streptomyces sp. NBC_00201]|uniref:hypothetical protein n=1 Tax=unclassified Streptomyces TaxID=2593676 RepID=UPI0022592058|nr:MULTISPECIES: hypothetical protein [unclassified Streptomyces]MCX5246176.1 hypothetical protein [Streptomyces sp. NBC_00201]
MPEKPNSPQLTAPVQAPPVHRDRGTEPGDQDTEHGAEAAKSACADLPGPARSMCRALQSG